MPRCRPTPARCRFGIRHRKDDTAFAHGCRVYDWAVGHRLGDAVEHPRLFEHDIRARRSRSGGRIGPAVARRDQPQVGKPEVEHRPRRLADILAAMGTPEHDRGRAHTLAASPTVPAKASHYMDSGKTL